MENFYVNKKLTQNELSEPGGEGSPTYATGIQQNNNQNAQPMKKLKLYATLLSRHSAERAGESSMGGEGIRKECLSV